MQETNYVNEWLGLLEGHDVTAILVRPNPRLLSIKSYHTYSDRHVRKIYLPYKAGGRKVASVGIFDHVFYTLATILLLPLALMQDAVIFFAPSYFHTVTIPVLKLFKKKVYVVVFDPQDVLEENSRKNILLSMYYGLCMALERNAVKKADKVFVVSRYLKNSLSKLNTNVVQVMSGTDTKYIDSIKSTRSGRKKIAYLGSLDTYRGADMLVKAFLKTAGNSKYELHILGGGPEEEHIKKLALGKKNIHVSGTIDHKAGIAICKSADILVMPFRNTPVLYKTMPLKTFEFIACGVPIVVTDTGEHAELIKDYEAGIVVDPSEDGIAKGMKLLLTDRKLYTHVKKNCLKHRNLVDYSLTRREFVNSF